MNGLRWMGVVLGSSLLVILAGAGCSLLAAFPPEAR